MLTLLATVGNLSIPVRIKLSRPNIHAMQIQLLGLLLRKSVVLLKGTCLNVSFGESGGGILTKFFLDCHIEDVDTVYENCIYDTCLCREDVSFN